MLALKNGVAVKSRYCPCRGPQSCILVWWCKSAHNCSLQFRPLQATALTCAYLPHRYTTNLSNKVSEPQHSCPPKPALLSQTFSREEIMSLPPIQRASKTKEVSLCPPWWTSEFTGLVSKNMRDLKKFTPIRKVTYRQLRHHWWKPIRRLPHTCLAGIFQKLPSL